MKIVSLPNYGYRPHNVASVVPYGIGTVTVDGDTVPQGSTEHTLVTAALVIGGLGLLALIGYSIYARTKLDAEIVHTQGVGKALEYEGGMMGIGLLGQAVGHSMYGDRY
jgi:hypothetical protein